MQRVGGVAELAAQRMERVDVVVRALDVAKTVQQQRQRVRIGITVAVGGGIDARPRPFAERVEIARPRHPDDRQVEAVADQGE